MSDMPYGSHEPRIFDTASIPDWFCAWPRWRPSANGPAYGIKIVRDLSAAKNTAVEKAPQDGRPVYVGKFVDGTPVIMYMIETSRIYPWRFSGSERLFGWTSMPATKDQLDNWEQAAKAMLQKEREDDANIIDREQD